MNAGIPLLINIGFCLGILLIGGAAAQAGQRTSAGGFVMTDLTGYSGSVQLSTSTGWRWVSTIGYFGSNLEISNQKEGAERISIQAGLWGGGTPLRTSTLPQNFTFRTIGSAQLAIPGGALAQDYVLETGTSPLTSPLHVSPALVAQSLENLSRANAGYTAPLGGRLYEIFARDVFGQIQDGVLARAAQLTLPFDDADGDGMVDGTSPPVRRESLSIWWLDEAHAQWVKIPNSTVDPSSRTVTAPIMHFSVYTVMGAPSFNPAEVRAFPVPWRPSGPGAGSGAGQTGTAAGITFMNLPSAATIRIYTLSGTLIKEITHATGLPTADWDGKSDAGEDTATGTYIYSVDGGGAKKNGKLVIIR